MLVGDNDLDMPFSFPATRDLWQYLGEFDALTQMNELALRDFLYRRERIRHSFGEKQAAAFVTKKSKKYNIGVHADVANRLALGMAHQYVCMVWNCADTFFRTLRSEHQAVTESSWTGDTKGKSRLDFALENLYSSKQQGRTAIGLHRYLLLEYARLIRNRIVHSRSTSEETVEEAYKDLTPHVGTIREEYGPKHALGRMNALTFENAVLFSRVAKHVATTLNDHAQPTNAQLAKAIDEVRFKRLNKPERQRRAKIGELRSRFGLNRAEAGVILDSGSLA